MTIKFLSMEEHQQVVESLLEFEESLHVIRYHSAGPEYTSLMVCFLSHNLVAAKTLLRLRDSFDADLFPVTVGYAIVRTMFEADVNAHYITKKPVDRSRQYIEFEHILAKREMDAHDKHRNSSNLQWREGMNFMWQEHWLPLQTSINTKYKAIRNRFETVTRKGKAMPFQNWSGKSIHQMAVEVDHEEAYDVFYAELSSFAHVDVRLAERFLHIQPDGLTTWSQQADPFDVGNVFRYGATFLSCFLELFADQFGFWSKDEIRACWNIGEGYRKSP
jgi:hypothetical protein